MPLGDRGLLKIRINESVLKESKHQNLADLISDHSPLFVKSSGPGSIASVSFRGTAATHTRVDWNGISLNNPMLGQTDFSLIPAMVADELIILPGGSSLSEGSGALGGSVRMKTNPKWDDNFYGSLGLLTGSFGMLNTNIDLGGGNDKLQTRIRVFTENSENDFKFMNPYLGEPIYQVQENGAYYKSGLLHELYFRNKKENIFSIKTWYQDSKRNFPALMTFSGRGYEEIQHTEELRFVLQWKKYGQKVNVENNISLNHSFMNYRAANNTALGKVEHFKNENLVNGLFFNNIIEYKISAKTLLRGLLNYDLNFVRNYDLNSGLGYNADRSEAGYTILAHSEISSALSVFGLVRTQLTDYRLIPLMPSAGIEIKPLKNSNLKIRSSYTRNYNLPGLNDLYWIPGGNPELKPEEGHSADFSFEFNSQVSGSFELVSMLNFYYSDIKNWILWSPGEFNFWQPQNIAEVIARGSDLMLTLKYNQPGIKTELSGNYAFTRTSNISESGNREELMKRQLIYIPYHKANFHAGFSVMDYSFNYHLSITGERYTTSSNENSRHSLPAYDIHDARIEKLFRESNSALRIGFGINNIFNKQYQAILYRAMPGRNASLHLKYTFN